MRSIIQRSLLLAATVLALAAVPAAAFAGGKATFKTADTGKTCGNDKNCFENQFADCKPARFTSGTRREVQLRYRITGRITGDRDDQCVVQMRFLAHPKPAWVDKLLTMVLDPGEPLGPQLKDAVGQCLSNAAPMDYQCSGALRGARTWGPARTGDGPIPEKKAARAGA